MFAGLFADDFIIRLPQGDRQALQADHGARPFEPLPRRAMREYVTIPGPLPSDRAALDRLLACSIAFVAGMPPKAKKRR